LIAINQNPINIAGLYFCVDQKSKGSSRKVRESADFAFQSENNFYEMGDTIHQSKRD
jgi:hypothetical protein